MYGLQIALTGTNLDISYSETLFDLWREISNWKSVSLAQTWSTRKVNWEETWNGNASDLT